MHAPDRRTIDVIADVHGCIDELQDLLDRLGYRRPTRPVDAWSPPEERTLVFAGDLVDRGPDTPAVLRLAMAMVERGSALAVVGNHDDKLYRALAGRPVKVTNGLETSLDQLSREPSAFRDRVRRFLHDLPAQAVLDDGRLVVAHAGLPEHLHGRETKRSRDFAMYGAVQPGRDEHGLPIRLDWAARYRGAATVVYGHTPVVEPVWRNNTIDIDTGCIFGNRLTALRYPERALVSVAARQVYVEKSGPFRAVGPGGPPVEGEALPAHLLAAVRSGAKGAAGPDDARAERRSA